MSWKQLSTFQANHLLSFCNSLFLENVFVLEDCAVIAVLPELAPLYITSLFTFGKLLDILMQYFENNALEAVVLLVRCRGCRLHQVTCGG